jgi:hypothetical protein
LKQRAEEELSWPGAVERMRDMTGEYREVEWKLANGESATTDYTDSHRLSLNLWLSVKSVVSRYPQSDGAQVLNAEQWREQMDKPARMFVRANSKPARSA